MRALFFLCCLTAGCEATGAARGPAPPGSGKADSAETVLLGSTSYCPDSAPYDSFDTVRYSRATGRYQALSFQASAGDQPDIAMIGGVPQMWLEDAGGNLIACLHNDDDSDNFDLQTESLAQGGLYYLIFADKRGEDITFRLRIDCTQGDCAVTHACGVSLPL